MAGPAVLRVPAVCSCTGGLTWASWLAWFCALSFFGVPFEGPFLDSGERDGAGASLPGCRAAGLAALTFRALIVLAEYKDGHL